MKIVNKSEFLELPNGILYSKYESLGIITGLFVKTDSLHNDWVYIDLISNVDCQDTGEFFDIMSAVESKVLDKFRFDLECGERDGVFDSEGMFVVYDKEDAIQLLDTIQKIVSTYPEVGE